MDVTFQNPHAIYLLPTIRVAQSHFARSVIKANQGFFYMV